MTIKKNYSDEIRKNLFSGNPDIIESTLKDIKQNGVIEVVPLLLDLYLVQEDFLLRVEIAKIIIDIKDKKIAELLIESLTSPKYKAIKKDIVSMVWQSRFDFTKFLDVFIDIFIYDNLDTGIEAFTVIEEILPNLKEDEMKQFRAVIKNHRHELDETRNALAEDLI